MMNRLVFAIVLMSAALLTTKLLLAQTQPAKPEPQTFAILYAPGPNWIKGKPIFEQDLQEHGQYMAKLLDQGHLELGGPFTDSSGGMAIITAKDGNEAATILKNDPGVTKGIFTATLRPWYIVFRKQVK
jgi:uncharacterized protein